MTMPEVSALHVYPVKSLRATGTRSAVVEPWGLAGDRRWMLVDAHTLRSVTQREEPGLARVDARLTSGGGLRLAAAGREPVDIGAPAPGPLETVRLFSTELELLPAGGAGDAWLSEYLGRSVRLVHLDEPAIRRPIGAGTTVNLADGYPLLATTTASLDALNTLIARGDRPHEGPVPMARFRPNVVIGGTAAWAEDDWRRVRIGEVVLRVAEPCARCVVATVDQITGERGSEPLRALGRHRSIDAKLLFGQNLIPERSGTLHVGDPLSKVE
jgi:uncharacterized protein